MILWRSNMLTTYLNTLKQQGNFTFEQISNLSGIPEATVKNIFSGKTEDPRYETISKIVRAMGGSLDATDAAVKKDDVEANTVIALKEQYEKHIQALDEHYKLRIAEMKEHYEERIKEKNEHIETIKLDKRWFRIATCILAVSFAALLVADIIAPGIGWFR